MFQQYQEALKRIPTQQDKIANALREAFEEGLTNVELNQLCLRYDARISDLRRKGYRIDVISEGKGIYRYFLKATPSQDYIYKNANDEIFEAIHFEFGNIITADQLAALLEEKGFTINRKHGWYRDKTTLH